MMREILVSVMTWVAAVTGLPEADLPDVAFVEKSVIVESVCGGLSLSRCGGDPVAYYDHLAPRGVLYLQNTWDPSSIINMSTLVHEMVHHLQRESGRHYRCTGAAETLAYRTQGRYLTYFGVPRDQWGFTPQHVFMMSRCRSPAADD